MNDAHDNHTAELMGAQIRNSYGMRESGTTKADAKKAAADYADALDTYTRESGRLKELHAKLAEVQPPAESNGKARFLERAADAARALIAGEKPAELDARGAAESEMQRAGQERMAQIIQTELDAQRLVVARAALKLDEYHTDALAAAAAIAVQDAIGKARPHLEKATAHYDAARVALADRAMGGIVGREVQDDFAPKPEAVGKIADIGGIPVSIPGEVTAQLTVSEARELIDEHKRREREAQNEEARKTAAEANAGMQTYQGEHARVMLAQQGRGHA